MKLSIITINRNNACGLRKTIQSVVQQTYSDFEYIVIDGASTDESVNVIKAFSDKITYWISEPDKGIYNAMNKGILKANGEYLLFLNSGDWLHDSDVVKDFVYTNISAEIISGNIEFNNKIWKSPEANELDFLVFFYQSLPHPGTFINKSLFLLYGLYNENNKIISDWEFFVKCIFIHKSTYLHFERIISCFDNTGISSQQIMQDKIREEKEIFYKRELDGFYKAFLKLDNELKFLRSHEYEYNEYMNLKNGKLKFIIKLLLFIKRYLKR